MKHKQCNTSALLRVDRASSRCLFAAGAATGRIRAAAAGLCFPVRASGVFANAAHFSGTAAWLCAAGQDRFHDTKVFWAASAAAAAGDRHWKLLQKAECARVDGQLLLPRAHG